MKPTLIKIIISSFFVAIIYACSLDRLTPIESSKTDINIDSLSSKKFVGVNNMEVLNRLSERNKIKKITVNNATQATFSIANGGKCTCTNANLKTFQGGTVSYPYDLEVLELFTLKDMLLNRKGTESYGRLLVTGGAVFLRATKDGVELTADLYNPPSIIIPSEKGADTGMILFNGALTPNEQFTWTVDSTQIPRDNIGKVSEKLVFNKTGYELFPRRLGWINVDRFYDFTGPKTRLKFTSVYPKIEQLAVFMVFPDINSVIQVFNGTSLEVPVGQKAKIVAIAETEDKEVFSFFSDITVEDKQTIEIKVIKTTEDDFLKALDKL